MRVLSALFLSLLLVGCSFSESNSDPTRRRNLEDRQKLIDAYSAIQGVYEGTFEPSTGVEQVRLTISYREEVVGKNDDGENIYLPVLTGRFTRLNTSFFDTKLDASYIPETGDITLTTQKAEGGTVRSDYYYVRGFIRDGVFESVVKSASGAVIGPINVRKVSSEVRSPSGDELEEYERYKARVSKFIGRYKAVVTRDPKMIFEIDIDIQVIEDFDGNRGLRPILISNSRRTDGFSRAGRHTISYLTDRGVEELIFTPRAGATGYEAYSLSAVWNDKEKSFKGTAVFPTFSAEFAAKPVK